jgi:hypothetical protein
MLYSDVYVKEPIDKIAEDWDFMNEKILPKFFGFRPVGDNVYGIRAITHDTQKTLGSEKHTPMDMAKNRRNYEIGPGGVVVVPRTPLTIHVTRRGTPHRTEFLFGYWHINDKDEIIIPLPPTDTTPPHLVIVMGHPKGNETDRIACYCQQCGSLVFMRELVTGTIGFQRFFQWEHETVREYNSDPRLRTCWDCGHVNPVGYTAFPTRDTPEEREQRMKW